MNHPLKKGISFALTACLLVTGLFMMQPMVTPPTANAEYVETLPEIGVVNNNQSFIRNNEELFIYTVLAGDTYYSIAKKVGITYNDIYNYNPQLENRENDLLYAGEQLELPRNKTYTREVYILGVDTMNHRILIENAYAHHERTTRYYVYYNPTRFNEFFNSETFVHKFYEGELFEIRTSLNEKNATYVLEWVFAY